MNLQENEYFKNYFSKQIILILIINCLSQFTFLNLEETRKAEHEIKANERQLQRTQYDLERDEKKLVCYLWKSVIYCITLCITIALILIAMTIKYFRQNFNTS